MTRIGCSMTLFRAVPLVVLLVASRAAAIPAFFGETGHYYDFVWAGEITWTEANQQAPTLYYHGHQGYLATIRSQSENDFLYQTYGHIFWEGWLGGWQELGFPPNEHWHWVTGEPWEYTNWAAGEPNDAGGTGEECYLQMWGYGTTGPGKWNDDADNTQPGNIGGYFVEYGVQPIPEPSSLVLIALGLGAAAGARRLRKRAPELPGSGEHP